VLALHASSRELARNQPQDSASNEFLPLTQVKERKQPQLARGTDKSSRSGGSSSTSSNTNSNSSDGKDSAAGDLVVGTHEAINLASALHALHKLLPTGTEGDTAPLAAVLVSLSGGSPDQVDTLTGVCRSTSDALLRLECVLTDVFIDTPSKTRTMSYMFWMAFTL